MTPDRHRQIGQIFDDVLKLAPEQRTAFLAQACAGDPSLRSDVESLLSSHQKIGNFIGAPAMEVAAKALAQAAPTSIGLTEGVTLESYEILSLIGAGGMGEVYLARDTQLDRKIALKVLRSELTSEADRLRRFQQEARAVSALNHPNIVTIHEIGRAGTLDFIAYEFVEGETLRRRLEKPLKLAEALDAAVQIASALVAAHAAGVIHRDLKPENIMVRPDGYVKVLDFGLAKLTEATPAADFRTQPGLVMGTFGYMSPEQARGLAVDARSDIFSFGVVLYEMMAGRRPFEGKTTSDVIAAVLTKEPEPLARYAEETPAELQSNVTKALAKNPDARYQNVKDLWLELKNLKQSVETAAPLKQAGLSLAENTVARKASRRTLLVGAVSAIGVIVLTAGAYWRFAPPVVRDDSAGQTSVQYTQLTNFADSATSPALSPDGRMLTFIRGESTFFGRGQIYVKLLPEGEPVQLTNDDLFKMGPKFSPDGARIAYTATADGGVTWSTWIVPVLGGQPRPLLANAEGLTWIPQQGADAASPYSVMFSEMTGRGWQMSIVASTESRTLQRTVYMPPENGMAHRSYLAPDGQQVLLIEMTQNSWQPCRVAPFDGSSPGKIIGPNPSQCTDAGWSPDGEWMYLTANSGNGYHIWRQRFPDGTPEQVTFGVTDEEGIHFAPDGRSFVTSIGNRQSTVWIHDSHGDRQITSEGFAFLPNISPDGKKVYYLVRGGGAQNFLTGGLWVTDLDSGQRARLLPDFLMRHYSISADGRRVVFVAAGENGRAPVWLASLNGSTPPRQLTTLDGWMAYFGAPNEVVFTGQEESAVFIYRVKEDGSELRKVVSDSNMALGISPDGQWVAGVGLTLETRNGLTLYPVAGGSPTLVCESCSPPAGIDNGPAPSPVSWSPDGKFFYLKFAASTYAIPLRPGEVLPSIPGSGFQSKDAVAALPGTRLISEQNVFPGPNPAIHASMKVTTQRNIYRVPVP
jgi:Tol biopolymer transport system component